MLERLFLYWDLIFTTDRRPSEGEEEEDNYLRPEWEINPHDILLENQWKTLQAWQGRFWNSKSEAEQVDS